MNQAGLKHTAACFMLVAASVPCESRPWVVVSAEEQVGVDALLLFGIVGCCLWQSGGSEQEL